ncbi:MAG: nitrogenase component 1 [Synergistaceae bacterium]|jgi:hypothetical protein|nr:nitrogenase component 1 [Synergistaceae bacterium]
MKNLLLSLPPFAPDYSGVCSVFFEFGGVMVIMDASGCTGNYTGYDEPRWAGSSSRVFCLGLGELDAIFGVEDVVVDKTLRYMEGKSANFVLILGSPVPMLIGADYKAIASRLEAELGIPILHFDTTAIPLHDAGAEAAYLELARRFFRPPNDKAARSVNILGAIPLDISQGTLGDFTELLADEGYAVNSTVSMNSSFDELAGCTNASLNVVCSVTGIEAAKYLRKQFDMPYMTGIPIGAEGSKIFLRELSAVMGGEEYTTPDPPRSGNGFTALILGEQIFAESIKRSLIFDLGFDAGSVDIASFFMLKDKLRTKDGNTIKLVCEEDLEALAAERGYDYIFGDPLYASLIEARRKFIEIPHVAVSSKVYRDIDVRFICGRFNKLVSLG